MRNERINASFFCIFDSFMRSKSVFEPFILSFGVHFGVHILISFSPYIINTNEKLNILKTSLMVKIIQRRVKHAKVLPCVFFIPLRMRVRDNIIILYTEVDSSKAITLNPFILKGFRDTLHKRPNVFFIHLHI